jgi:hypothetical protein
MGEQARVVFVQVNQGGALPECSWEELSEPGTYVEKETGNLYRIPGALLQDAAPLSKIRFRTSRLVQISKNPFMTNFVARMTCAEHNIKFNF